MSTVTAGLSKAKQHALELIDNYPRGSTHWAHVDWEDLVKWLRTRIKDPGSINQRESHWCGPAAVCRSFAADAPSAYAKMVLDLVGDGCAVIHHGRFAGGKLHPPAEIRNHPFAASGIVSADWVPLVSLRVSLQSPHEHLHITRLFIKAPPGIRITKTYLKGDCGIPEAW